jgi:hypothetical protein
MYIVTRAACLGYLVTAVALVVVLALLIVPPESTRLGASRERLRVRSASQDAAPPPKLGPLEDLFVLRAAPHEWTHLVRDRFKRMSAELGPERVFLLIDDTRLPELVNGTRLYQSRWSPGQQVLLINEEECERASRFHEGLWHSPQTAMALLFPYLMVVDFKHIWFVEWDVDCWGNYTACYELQPNFDQDLLSVLLEKYSPGIAWWYWWDKLVGEKAGVPLESRWRSFFPLVRLSKRFLSQLYENMRTSSGYCETYVPTLCGSIPNCTLARFPDEKLGNFEFVQGQPLHHCSRPAHKDNKLYHPCKGNR